MMEEKVKMDSSVKSEYSVWILPQAGLEQALQKTILEIAAIQGENTFFPHVTLQGDLCGPSEEMSRSVAMMAQHIPLQRWRVRAVECGDHFFRCLYLRFDEDVALLELQDKVCAFTRTCNGLSPFPHLSLAYGRVTEVTRQAREDLMQRFAACEIAFDRIAVVRSSKDIPITEWRILEQHTLVGL